MTKATYIESENFIERTDINEFLRDHRVIGDLYNIVMKQHADAHRLGEGFGKRVFNLAYRMCNIASTPRGKVDEIQMITTKESKTEIVTSAYCVAWALLRLHEGLIYVSPLIVRYLQDECRRSGFYSCYQNFLRNYAGTFEETINFSGIATHKETKKSPSKTIEENFNDTKMSFLESAQKLIERNKELEAKLKSQEEIHGKELEERQAMVNTLSNRVNVMRKSLDEKDKTIAMLNAKMENPRTVIKEVVRKEVVHTPESKIFCAQSLAKYAISLPKDSDAAFIATTMQDICVRNRFFDNEVFDIIESIKTEREKARAEMEKKQREAIEMSKGTTFNIEHVDQLNPSAMEVNNTYERKSLGAKLNDIFIEFEDDVKPMTRITGTINLDDLGKPTYHKRKSKE